MVKVLSESSGNVFGVEINGKVTAEVEKELIDKVNAVLEEHTKINILVVLGEGAGWGLKAGMEDIKWFITHMKNISKIAIVSDSSVWKWLVKADAQFAKLAHIGEKHFEVARLNDAWAWVKE